MEKLRRRLCRIAHPSPARGYSRKSWVANRGGAVFPCVGRTLLSAAFDFDFELASKNCKNKTNLKSGGQECPPHMNYRSFVTVTSS